MLQEDGEEPFDRPEQRPVDHERPVPGPVLADELQVEQVRELEVHLEGRKLPAAVERVLDVHVDLRGVEGTLALGDRERDAGSLQRPAERLGRPVPLLRLADELLGPGGQLGLELGDAEGPQNLEDELQQAGQLGLQLVGHDEDVGVVLGEAPDPGEPVQHAGALEAVDGAELEQTQRQLPVRAGAGAVDQHVHRAVHRLGVVGGALHLHRGVHAVLVPAEVPGLGEQGLLRQVRE